MLVECINDKGRPNEIPITHWVKKGHAYTILAVFNDMNGVPYCILEEIDLRELHVPYKGFAVYRFSPIDEAPASELIKELELELTN
jgi:hypothetical protein